LSLLATMGGKKCSGLQRWQTKHCTSVSSLQSYGRAMAL
jgi:transposase-like protein